MRGVNRGWVATVAGLACVAAAALAFDVTRLDRHPELWAGSAAVIGLSLGLGALVARVVASRRVGPLERAAVLFAMALLVLAGHAATELASDAFRGDAGRVTAFARHTGCFAPTPAFGGRNSATLAAALLGLLAGLGAVPSRSAWRSLGLLVLAGVAACVGVALAAVVAVLPGVGGGVEAGVEGAAAMAALVIFVWSDPRSERGWSARLFAAAGLGAALVGGHLWRVSSIHLTSGMGPVPESPVPVLVGRFEAVEATLPAAALAAILVLALLLRGAKPVRLSSAHPWLAAAATALGLALVAQPLAERRLFARAMSDLAADDPYAGVPSLGGSSPGRLPLAALPAVEAERTLRLDAEGRVVASQGEGHLVEVVAPPHVDARALARAIAKVRRPEDRFVLATGAEPDAP